MPEKFIINADTEHSGIRLDAFVARAVPALSRSRAKRLIDDGFVRINGFAAKAAKTVKPGDRVEVEVPAPVEPSAIPQDIPLDIIYEDADIIVVNKSSGMVTHPAAGHPDATLVNALIYHCKNLSGIGGELKPGIVHRLDIGTSGVIIAAKNDDAHRNLSAQFKARTVTKVYLALVFGSMRTDSGKFDSAIGRSMRDRKRMSGRTKKGRTALTEWKVIERFGPEFSWIEIRLHTGRMHQIRVHFSEAGHPLVGDTAYGAKEGALKFPRPALHAFRLEVDHPRTGKRISFQANLPDDIERLLGVLRLSYAKHGRDGRIDPSARFCR